MVNPVKSCPLVIQRALTTDSGSEDDDFEEIKVGSPQLPPSPVSIAKRVVVTRVDSDDECAAEAIANATTLEPESGYVASSDEEEKLPWSDQ